MCLDQSRSSSCSRPSRPAAMALLQAIKYQRGELQVLDQLQLPGKSEYIHVNDTKDGWAVIRKMQVRGAPAIAVTGCLSLAREMEDLIFQSTAELHQFVSEKLEYLVTARPTAVNMEDAARKLTLYSKQLSHVEGLSTEEVMRRILAVIEKMVEDDIETNKTMSRYGAEHIMEHYNKKPVRLLTHCNTGALATAGYGTALGVVRYLHEQKLLDHVYCTETRPYNQGSRLTAYEFVVEEIPGTLICDSMVSMLMKEKNISAVVVGADRVTANGDTANKIGTYQVAIAAKYHKVPFYVIAPTTSVDLTIQSGEDIVIEERPSAEMTTINGKKMAPEGIGCWNPAFDVTPAELITGGIVTEHGIFPPSQLKSKLLKILH